jgi:hypothetical protein
MLQGDFVAIASSLKTRLSPLYLEAQINGQNIPCLVHTKVTSFVSSMFIYELDLLRHRADKPIKIRFAKDKPYVINKVALHMILKCGTFKFLECFTLCVMDEVDLNLSNIFFETHSGCEMQVGKYRNVSRWQKNDFEVDKIPLVRGDKFQ